MAVTRLAGKRTNRLTFRMRFVVAGCCCLALLLGSPMAAWAAKQEAPVVGQTPDQLLWEQALEFQEVGESRAAAEALLELHRRYPGSSMAENAYWRALQLLKAAALASDKPDWAELRTLAKEFATEFPKSEHAQAAYLEVGITHYRMRLFREALIYLNLFFRRYPDSPLTAEASMWKADTLVAIDKTVEAEQIYRSLAVAEQPDIIRQQAVVSLGQLQFAGGRFDEALKSFGEARRGVAPDSLADLSLVRMVGLAQMRMGHEAEGRELLARYVNLVETAPFKNDALFELAESYHRQGQGRPALILYDEVVTQGGAEDREVVLSRFRQAQYLDTGKRRNTAALLPPPDLTDPAGDPPYLAVVEGYPTEPIAQEARQDLLQRYLARDDFDAFMLIGNEYLRNVAHNAGRPGSSTPEVGRVLTLLMDELLKRGNYQKVYDLYRNEYAQVTAFGQGRLLYLVGRALESMYLYDQASVVYYRALAMPLTVQDKTDLYFRRVAVYLAMGDSEAADRLLEHLRRIYRTKDELGKVFFLSGRLCQARGENAAALDFYDKAEASPVAAADQGDYARTRLELLFEMQQLDPAAVALERYQRDGWLAAENLQFWYGRLGDARRQRQEYDKAREAYLAAIAEGLPQEGETAQAVQLYLGDVLLRQGDGEAGRAYLEKAVAGPDPLRQEFAKRRLQEQEIDQALLEVGPLSR